MPNRDNFKDMINCAVLSRSFPLCWSLEEFKDAFSGSAVKKKHIGEKLNLKNSESIIWGLDRLTNI